MAQALRHPLRQPTWLRLDTPGSQQTRMLDYSGLPQRWRIRLDTKQWSPKPQVRAVAHYANRYAKASGRVRT
jgi:hypothetical protein